MLLVEARARAAHLQGADVVRDGHQRRVPVGLEVHPCLAEQCDASGGGKGVASFSHPSVPSSFLGQRGHGRELDHPPRREVRS